VGVAQVEVGLDGEKALGARNPALACGDIPRVAERIFRFAQRSPEGWSSVGAYTGVAPATRAFA
jgi:hypothetical protein